MVDPHNVTDFERRIWPLEEFLLFSLCVAGKRADQQAKKLDKMLASLVLPGETPFQAIQRVGPDGVRASLEDVRMGQYGRLATAFCCCSVLDPATCSLDELERVPGLGPKTARFFLMHSRPGQRLACLDTHILAELRSIGVDAPRSTPTGRKYAELERVWLDHCDSLGVDPAEYDLQVWSRRTVSKM